MKEPAVGNAAGSVFMFELDDADRLTDLTASPLAITRTKFFQPNHLTPRIAAQAGWFSAHSWVKQTKRYSRFENLARYRGRIERVLIKPSAFADLRSALDRLGVNYSTMFPDLDGLTRHVNWRSTVGPDEV